MTDRGNDHRARRIEFVIYLVAAATYVAAGYVLRSGVLNWIVGPAWFIAWVTLVTPLVLRIKGIHDPDGKGVPLPKPEEFASVSAVASTSEDPA